MSRPTMMRRLVLAITLMSIAAPATVAAQRAAVPRDRLEAYAAAYNAIGKLRDRYEAEFAESRNKKPETLQQLHDNLLADVAGAMKDAGITQEEYDRITFVVSTDSEARAALNDVLGIAPPPPDSTAKKPPAGNPHLDHVMNAFGDTPNGDGLLPTALVEADIALQHARLAAADPANLTGMKLHAGHVIHALDPAVEPMGPGPGYGLKKAAAAIATHIDLAAKVPGASRNITTHSVHVAASARNTSARADRIIELAKRVRASESAEEAAALVADLEKLCGEIMTGVDANGDGMITWEAGEGGLQHVEQHMQLLMQGENRAF